MKKLFAIIVALLFTAIVWAQSPQKLSYQAVIRNSSNQLVTSHAVGMKITILQGSTTGTVVYTETQTPTTNANGLVSIEIGGGTGFDAINWANGPYFIKTETDPAGAASYTITGTSQLLSVPYALLAKKSETGDYNTLSNLPSLNIANWNAAYGWGNHTGLYRPVAYVPAWNEITSNPFSLTSPSNNQLLKYNSVTSKWENWTPNFLSNFTETDPVYASNFDFTGAVANDLLQFNGTKWIKLTPNFSLANHSHTNVTTTTSGFMSGTDKTKLDGLQNADGTETKISAGTSITVTGTGTIANPYVVNSSSTGSILPGTTNGDILYWNGTVWQLLHPGTSGQVLRINDAGIPTWQNATAANLLPPTVTTLAATKITSNSAIINGIVNGNGFLTYVEFEWGLTDSYGDWIDFEDEKVSTGTTDMQYKVRLDSAGNNLEPATTYHYRIVAESAINRVFGNDMTFTTLPLPIDADGNAYSEVRIGTQVWMKENLKTTKYRNGDLIPNVNDQTEWGNLTTGAWCYYNNESSNGDIYGRMYNYYAVADPRNLCPTGWHVPSDDEWTVLEEFYGGENVAGGKLKEGYEGYDPASYNGIWGYPNTGATNESGFSALPGGNRYPDAFHSIGLVGDWWTSTEWDADKALLRNMFYNSTVVGHYNGTKKFGFSVRCIKDIEGSKSILPAKPLDRNSVKALR